MSSIGTSQIPTRFLSLAAAEFLCNFFIQAKTKLDLDSDEALITSFIVSRSLQNIFQNRFEYRTYGFEYQALPQAERMAVSIKEITSALQIPRETVRRKLITLLSKDLVIKTEDGYIFPPQLNEMDNTSEFRKSIEESLTVLLKRFDKVDALG